MENSEPNQNHNSADVQLVVTSVKDGVMTIQMDDGKSNVISPSMLNALKAALDQAERANSIVILTGREDIFSAGFDLGILKKGAGAALGMLLGGFKLSRRLLSFPTPVVVACNGHSIAMGAFLLLSGDYRIGTRGEFKIAANEVKIGLTMPHSAVTVCRQRLAPAHFNRAVLLSEFYSPETAVSAGFLDEIVAADELAGHAAMRAAEYADLDLNAHRKSKRRMRRGLLREMTWSIHKDRFDFVLQGLAMMRKSKKR